MKKVETSKRRSRIIIINIKVIIRIERKRIMRIIREIKIKKIISWKRIRMTIRRKLRLYT